MRRRAFFNAVCALGAAVVVPGTSAQVDGRGGQFQDDLFANLEGNWILTREIRGAVVKNTVSVKRVLQGQFLLMQMRDAGTPARYEADVYIGYSYTNREYIAHWIDNFGGHFSARGKGRREGNSVEFKFEYPDGPFFNTFTWDPVSKTWTCHLESVGKDARRSTFARDTLVRAQ